MPAPFLHSNFIYAKGIFGYPGFLIKLAGIKGKLKCVVLVSLQGIQGKKHRHCKKLLRFVAFVKYQYQLWHLL